MWGCNSKVQCPVLFFIHFDLVLGIHDLLVIYTKENENIERERRN